MHKDLVISTFNFSANFSAEYLLTLSKCVLYNVSTSLMYHNIPNYCRSTVQLHKFMHFGNYRKKCTFHLFMLGNFWMLQHFTAFLWLNALCSLSQLIEAFQRLDASTLQSAVWLNALVFNSLDAVAIQFLFIICSLLIAE